MLCVSCGFQNPPGMRFCGNCGVRLADAPSAGAPLTLVGEPAPADFSPESLGVMMGADLLERMRRAGLEATGQRRNVTVLFTDLTGYTALSGQVDSEDLYEMVQQYIRLLINCVYKYEGVVDKLTGDGLMALFGAPIAHENNAERAVRAALDMQTEVNRLSQEMKERLGHDVQMRVGLHAGTVIVGGIGSSYLMNYTAIGDTVNLAHRLEEVATPGTVLVSESVFRQVRAVFDFPPEPTFYTLKGIERPTPAYTVMQLKTRPGAVRGLEGLRAPMIGRENELEQLHQAVNDLLEQRRGQLVLITGEAGLGKSRLTDEFKAQVVGIPLRVLEGQTQAYRRSLSYWIFLDVLFSFLGIPASTPQVQARERLIQACYQAMDSQASEALPYLENLLSLPPSDPAALERLRYLDAGQLRQQTFLAVRDLLLAEARCQPLLIILEDLHWADEASMELLLFLLEALRQAPIFILGISRQVLPGPMEKMVDWANLNLAGRFQIIQLQYLSIDQSERLLDQLLNITALPHKLREQILQRAAGIPFYLEEILRTLIDNGVIRRENGSWSAQPEADLVSSGVPDNLQGLILARFDRLNNVQRRVLQVASVIGKNFALPVLDSVLQPLDPMILQLTLAVLVERQFIQPLPGAPENQYTFRHILMSDAIYGTLLRRERGYLHGRVGEAIEALYPDRLDEQVELLARHYSWSPNLERALYYLTLAGQKAARSYVNLQALQHFEQALAILPKVQHTLAQMLEVQAGLGDVLVLIGEYSRAREHYLNALESIALEGSCQLPQECCALQRKVGTTHERQGEYDLALYWFHEALHILQSEGEAYPVEKARVLNEVGWIDFRRGNLDEAEENIMEALRLVEKTNQYDVTASIYNRLGGIYYQKEQFDRASNFLQKSLALREEIGDIVAVARSYNNLGLLNWKMGKWDSALEAFMRSFELHADLGDVEGMMDLHGNLGLLQLDRGNVEEARRHLEESLTIAQQIGHIYIVAMTYLYLSRLHVLLDEGATALNFGQQSLDILQKLGAQDDLVSVYCYLGMAELCQDHLDEASQWTERALQLFDQLSGGKTTPQAEDRGRVLRVLGEIARRRDQLILAEEYLKESSAIFMANGNHLERGRTLISLALLSTARGDQVGAGVLLKEARLIFSHLGASLDLRRLEAMASAGSIHER